MPDSFLHAATALGARTCRRWVTWRFFWFGGDCAAWSGWQYPGPEKEAQRGQIRKELEGDETARASPIVLACTPRRAFAGGDPGKACTASRGWPVIRTLRRGDLRITNHALFSQNAISGFQTSQTLPAIVKVPFSGAMVSLPGCQPEGVSSPVAWWCW